MNINPQFFDDKKNHHSFARSGNPYLILSLKDVFETFHFAAFVFLGLQLAAVVVIARNFMDWFQMDPFLVGGIYLSYCLLVNAIEFFTKFGQHISVFVRAALISAGLTILPVALIEICHRMNHLIEL